MSTVVEEKTEAATPRQGRRASSPGTFLESVEAEFIGITEQDDAAALEEDTEVLETETTDDTDPEVSTVESASAELELVELPDAVATSKDYPLLAETLEDLVYGAAEANTARAIGNAAALELGLSPKANELLNSLLVLSATDLSRGNPWDRHSMNVRDWFEGFLFEDVTGWLAGIGDPYTFRAFRTAMSSNDALAAFNSLPALVRYPGVRDEVDAAVRHYAGSLPNTQQVFAAAEI